MLVGAILGVVAWVGLFPGAMSQEWGQKYGLQALERSPDAALVDLLLQSSLPEVASRLCEQRLAAYPADSDAYAQWLMLAMQVDCAQRLDRGNSATDLESLGGIDALVAARMSSSATASPRAAWLAWKRSWCRWFVQQRALAAYLAAPAREELREWILAQVRLALDEVEELAGQLRTGKGISSAGAGSSAGNGASIPMSQRLDLQGSVELLRADLLYQRSQCYAAGSDDRLAAATEMLNSLDRALAKLPGDWIGRPALGIAQAQGYVQLGQPQEALQKLQGLWEQLQQGDSRRAETQHYLTRVAALAAQASNASQAWPQAAEWIARGGGWTASPELALEYFVSEMGRERDPQRALAIKRDLGKRFGRYWEQRAEAVMIADPAMASAAGSRVGEDTARMAALEIFRIEIRQLLAAEKWPEALEKLRQAEEAVRGEAPAEALALALQRGALLEKQGNRFEAAEEFARAAENYPNEPKASSAALMSAWLIREPESDAAESTKEAWRDAYDARLQRVWRGWPDSDGARQAARWREQQMLEQRDWKGLATLWSERVVAPEAVPSCAARLALLVCLEQDAWLDGDRTSESELNEAIALLRDASVQSCPEGDREACRTWLQQWARPMRCSAWQPLTRPLAGLQAIDAWIAEEGPALSEGDTMSQRASVWENDPLGRAAMMGWVGEIRASKLLSRPGPGEADEYRAIGSLAGALESELRSDSAASWPALLRERWQRNVDYGLALASIPKDGGTSCAAELAQQRARAPRSAWWLYQSARTLQSLPAYREQALGMYRQWANGVPAGSDAWLEARVRTVETLGWLGQVDQARQLGELVMATYPQIDAPWRERFRALTASRQ